MENEQAYKEIINTIIESKITAFGRVAIDKAKIINGLTIDEKGQALSFSSDPKTVIHNLLITYEEICGRVSTISARTVTTRLRNKYPNLELPSELK
jgi:hypothetical protein